MKQTNYSVLGVPAVLYGEASDRVWLFVHGKSGCKEEGAAFAELVCPAGAQVLAVDLPEHGARKGEPGFDPWHAAPELRETVRLLRRDWARVGLRANSIGAWFSMQALADAPPDRALFVSPLLDMEKLILSMMLWASVDEARLEREGEIETAFGETLSWRYLQYARAHPLVNWAAPTAVLYAGRDELTDRGTVDAFVRRFGCELDVMEDGEHWFHTPEQLAVLRRWEAAHAVFPPQGGKSVSTR